MRAGAYAAGLARRQKSRLVVVHVLTVRGLATLVPAGVVALRQANQEIAEDLRRQVAEAAEARGVPVTFVAVQGDPYHELVRIADQVRADVVVVGASTKRRHPPAGGVPGGPPGAGGPLAGHRGALTVHSGHRHASSVAKRGSTVARAWSTRLASEEAPARLSTGGRR